MTDGSNKSLSVKCPGDFTGKQENWERWKTKYINYTSSIDWRYGQLFKDVEALPRTTKIDKDWLDDWDIQNPVRVSDKTTREVMQLSTDLYAQLTDLLQGTAANLCKRHSKARCGLECLEGTVPTLRHQDITEGQRQTGKDHELPPARD